MKQGATMASPNLDMFKTTNVNALKKVSKMPGRKKKPLEQKCHHKRPLSLTDDELKQLEEAARGIPLATFIKSKLYEIGILEFSK